MLTTRHKDPLSQAALALELGDGVSAADGAALYLRSIGTAKTERAAGLELLAEAHAATGRADEAAEAARELRAIAEFAGTDPLLGAARHAEGHALAAAGSPDEAREAFEDAVQLLARRGSRSRTLARTLRALGREEVARRELELARERFAKLGASAEERRTAALVRASPADERSVLSARESEILRLVAEGLSNKQIAACLTLSEHTIHRRVANILVKLRVPSRAAAAAYAAKHGLTE